MRKKRTVILLGLVLVLASVPAPVGAHVRDMTLRRGDVGNQVAVWQHMLNRAPYLARPRKPLAEDGIFGPATQRATRGFERQAGDKDTRDGIVTTEDRIRWLGSFLTSGWRGDPPLLSGMRDPRVGHVQVALNVWITRENVPRGRLWVDAIFRSDTQAAVRAFQASTGLASDGIVGPRTWKRLSEQQLLEFPPSDNP